jgi:putative FmdB family regulatory protein
MPHYDYVCIKCGHEEEVFQKITADPLIHCSSCHNTTYRRKPGGGAGLQFRGSGFYDTDYGPSRPSETPSSSAKSEGPCGCGKSSCSSR